MVTKAIQEARDLASRMSGAEEMGFFKPTLYHGTSTVNKGAEGASNKEFELFDAFQLFEGQDNQRSVSRSEVGKLGVSLAEQPEVAQDFARQASPDGNMGATMMPLRFRSEKMASIELTGEELNTEIYGTVIDAWKQGFDSIRFLNYTTPGGTKGSFFLVKDPAQIRSVHADFDPKKKDSRNLMASVAGGLGVAIAAGQPEEAQAEEFDPDAYLSRKKSEKPQFDPDAYLAKKRASLQSSKPEDSESPQPKPPETFEDHFLAIPGMKPISEFAAAANRSIFEMLDFIGPDNINAVMQLAGSDQRVPTLTDSLGSEGGYMESGMARDAVQVAGELLPVAAGMAPVTGRNVATAKGATQELLGLGAAAVQEPARVVAKAAQPVTEAVADALPSKAKDAAKLPLYRQSGDVAAAGFKLDENARVVKDKVQQKALKAGIDEGMVAMISAANGPTKKRIKGMIDVLEKGRKNLEYRHFNTPQKVVGLALEDRLRIIQGANSEAAKRLDIVANKLKKKPVSVAPAINKFVGDMEAEGIKVDLKAGVLDFSDSSIEGLEQAQSIIKRVFQRLYNTKDPTIDAFRVHNAKRFIDAQVSYGRSEAGLSGRMEGIVKSLRRNLDKALDTSFPEYDAVNSMYSETRAVIDEVQSLAGPKVDLMTENTNKALGAMSRKVLSNYSSGPAIENLLGRLDGMAKRYSSPLETSIDDELFKLVSAEAEMRRMFPDAAKPNTFQGEIGAEVMRGAEAVATGSYVEKLKAAKDALSKPFSSGDDAKLDALKGLLED